jgi:hypothetical protein
MRVQPFGNEEVAAKFDSFDPPVRHRLLVLRALIFAVASKTEGVGPLVETLKWGQPGYLTAKTKSGATIRISTDDTFGPGIALYVSCNSNLVDDWRYRYPELKLRGNRSLHLRDGETIETPALCHCIALALTYHRRKKL